MDIIGGKIMNEEIKKAIQLLEANGYEVKKKKIEIVLEDPYTFEVAWNLYQKKVGPKDKLKAKWNKLSLRDRKSAIEYIPLYIQSQPDKQFRKNFQTFLNQRGWEDELIFKQSYEQRRAIDLTAKAARILGSDYQG